MTDPRQADIPVAEFTYRHEAELAAGFLEDARIPFRLQIDDAGGADVGVTIGRPAVLWVRAEDAPRAREVLDLDAADAPAPHGADAAPVRSQSPGGEPGGGHLHGVERALAGIVGAALLAVGAALPGATSAGAVVCWVVGGTLVVSSLAGHTVGPVKAVLRMISGVAP